MAEGIATMNEVFQYLSDKKTNGYTLSEFRTDWASLSDKDKLDLKTGIGNGSLNY